MRKYIAPYSEIISLKEEDIITTSGGLEDIGQEGNTSQGGGEVDDSMDFDW